MDQIHTMICQGQLKELPWSPDQLENIMSLGGQLKDEVYSFEQLLVMIKYKNIRACWEQLAPYFPVSINRKTSQQDLTFLEKVYGMTSSELEIINEEELLFYNQLMTASRYGLMEVVEETDYTDLLLSISIESSSIIIPTIIIEAIEEAIKGNKHDHLEVAKYLINELPGFLRYNPELIKELIVVVCRNGSLPIFQYCEQQLGENFTEKVNEAVLAKLFYFNLGFLVQKEKFLNYFNHHYTNRLYNMVSYANFYNA